jgi:PAS domain S-box-containing protein
VLASGTAVSFEWDDYIAELSPYEDGALCIARDIGALKARQRQTEKMMVDTQGVAHLGTWEWDISQPNATWSEELYRIYGLTPEAYTPSYEQYLTMVHDADRQRVIEATNRVFHDHVAYSHDERIFRPDGTMRYLHTWAFPVKDAAGNLTHLIGVCQDITDRALAEEGVRQANADLETRVVERTRQLESALRDLEAFNSMVSHDLRAPLAVIQMAADMVLKVEEAKVPGYVERIKRGVSTMTQLMNDLLTFARLGDAALQPRELDVTSLCNDIMNELRSTAPARDATVVVAPELRCTADPMLFRLVLANLLGNAWKYTQRATPARIEVGAIERDGTAALFVRDNGIGFDMAEYARLFAPFERLGSSTDFSGTGVGLATVHRILERHGGSIAAESELGAGATFYVRMPSTTTTQSPA